MKTPHYGVHSGGNSAADQGRMMLIRTVPVAEGLFEWLDTGTP